VAKVKVLIIEDERIISESIALMLVDLGYEVVGQKKTEKEAMNAIANMEFDLALVDINLEGGEEGIKIGAELKRYIKPFIYLTSYSDEQTLEKVKPTMPGSFIVKPFTKRDIYSNIEIVLARERNKSDKVKKHKIKLHDGYKTLIIFAEDILWIRSDGVYLEVQTVEKKILERTSFLEFIPSLPEEFICRVHRSWAVNLNFVQEISSKSVVINNQKIPISDSYRKAVHENLANINLID
tara:strand:+ start:598 stop:1311 length:714 start_codon:yes stop_codon:yes gene_type:complete